MRIRRAELLDRPDEKPAPIPITGLGEMHSGIDAMVEAINVILAKTKKVEDRVDGLSSRPDAWRARVTKRNGDGRITEVVLRPIYDKPGTMN